MAKSLKLKRIMEHVFGLHAEETAVPASEASPVRHPSHERIAATPGGVATPHEVAAGMLRVIQSGDRAKLGHLQLIGLSKFREIFGPDWPQMEEKARSIASTAIARHLVKGDMFTPYGNEEYLVLFGALTETEAQVKTALIAQEISSRLIGDAPHAPTVDIKTAVAVVGDELMFETVDANRLLRETVKRALRPTDPVLHPEVTDAKLAAGSPVSCEEALAAIPIAFVYRPIWFVSRKVISSYVCLPARATSSGGVLYGHNVLPGKEQSGLVAALDCVTLHTVSRALDGWTADDPMPVVSMAVHFETMARSSIRDQFFEICKTLSPSVRDHLVFELVAVPEDVASSRMYQLLSLMKVFCRATLLRFPLGCRNLDRIANQPLHGVGLELGDDQRPERDLIKEMELFAQRVSHYGYRSYIHGVRSVSLAVSAFSAGFDYIDGDSVMSINNSPASIHSFKVEDIYRFILGCNNGLGTPAAASGTG